MKKNDTQNDSMPKTVLGFYLRRVYAKYFGHILLFLVIQLVAGCAGVVWPYIERWIVAMFENAPAGVDIMHYVMPTILIIVALNMAMTSVSIIESHVLSIVSTTLRRRISEILTDYVHTQSMSFWVNRMAGSINSNIGFCVTGSKVLTQDAWKVVVRLVVILTNSALLFTVNQYIAYMFIGVFILRAAFMWSLRKPMKKSAEYRAKTDATLSGKILDGFANQMVVKSFAGATREHNYLDQPRQENVNAVRRAQFIQRLSWAIPTYLWDCMLGLTLVFCAYLYQKGLMNVADIVYSMSVYYTVMGSISSLVNQMPDIIDGLSSANKGYSSLVVPIDVIDAPNAPDLKVTHGRIEIKNVSFKYKNKYVLRDLSLTIKPGERVGIVGPSGAGKTTLVNLLMRFYDVKSGAILIDGADIRDVAQDSLRENIAFIPQEPAMFNRTIGENIAYGRPGATMTEIKAAARFASADKFINSTEKKYDSLVGDRGIKLSGGQRQRIAIARAFIKDAPILILDEATSALDSETEVAIQKSFEKLSRNRTTIAIAHRLSTLRNMDRIVVLDDGKIVESGTHNALLRRGGEYARLWKMQSGGFLQEDEKDKKE